MPFNRTARLPPFPDRVDPATGKPKAAKIQQVERTHLIAHFPGFTSGRDSFGKCKIIWGQTLLDHLPSTFQQLRNEMGHMQHETPREDSARRDRFKIASINLSRKSHTPAFLVSAAVNSFHTKFPSQVQTTLRNLLRTCVENVAQGEGGPIRPDALETWISFFDQYFFMKTLTGRLADGRDPVLGLDGMYPCMHHEEHIGSTGYDRDNDRMYLTVNMTGHPVMDPANQTAENKGRDRVVTSLLILMVRLYLHYYGCFCEKEGDSFREFSGCQEDVLSTYGVTGYGHCFQSLLGAIVGHIRSWGPGCEGFASSLVDEGRIYTRGWALEEYAHRLIGETPEAACDLRPRQQQRSNMVARVVYTGKRNVWQVQVHE